MCIEFLLLGAFVCTNEGSAVYTVHYAAQDGWTMDRTRPSTDFLSLNPSPSPIDIPPSIRRLELRRHELAVSAHHAGAHPVLRAVQSRLPVHALFEHFPDVWVVVVRVARTPDDGPVRNVHTDAGQYLSARKER